VTARREFGIGILCAAAVVLIWTFFIVLSRATVRVHVAIWDLALLRFAFAAAAVLPFVMRRPAGRRLGGLTLRRAVLLAMFGGLGFTGFAFLGFAHAPAAHGAVLMPGTLPFSTAVAALVILGERVSPRKALGLAAILVGICLMAIRAVSDQQGATWQGDLMFPLASACWAMFAVLSRKWRIDPVDATLAVPLFSCLIYLPCYIAFAPDKLAGMAPADMLWLGVFQGLLATVASMWAFSRVVAIFGPVKTTMITALAPVLAALAAIPILGEAVTPLIACGLAAVTLGMVIGVGGPGSPAVQPSVK
jgi:drug/metabolite transporter (DMT)-like permease